jgi:16S rRNA (cytosine967-C5)-methyltransferase
VTPAARLAAAIEVLDTLAASRAPADGVLKAWGREHRFAGSGDRRAIAERVYACLRARARLGWRMQAEDGRALVLGALADLDGLAPEEIDALCSGQAHAPAPLTAEERARLAVAPEPPPAWVAAGVPPFAAGLLQARFGEEWRQEAKALITARAPVDLRVNALRGEVPQALNLLGHDRLAPERTPLSAWGLRLPPDAMHGLEKLRAFTSGWVEVQDEGSQVCAFLAGAAPGSTVVDYCAGGGGKTLALGAARPGRLVACDVNPRRLEAMRPRLERAGVTAEIRRLGPEGEGTDDLRGRADLVLVDAPCSGSGTWRRHPEAAWRLSGEAVDRLSVLQRSILARTAGLVRPGGRLAYVTCSVFASENDEVAADFAAGHPEFRPLAIADAALTPDLTDAARARLAELSGGGHTLQLTPRRAGTDGFFIALFERRP